MRNPVSREFLLDNALRNPSVSAQLDHISRAYPSEEIIDGGISGGAIESFGLGRERIRSGVREFTPGIHTQSDVLVSSVTDEDSQILAKNPRRFASPFTAHIIVDQPERTKQLDGDFSFANVAGYVQAMARHVADTRGSDLNVYFSDGLNAGLLYEGDSRHGYLADHAKSRGRFIEEADASLNGLLKVVQGRIDPKHDVAIVVSDLQDVYLPDSNEFDWEDVMRSTALALGDRLWVNRVTSPAHVNLPLDILEGVSPTTIAEINDSYREEGLTKEKVIQQVLGKLSQVQHIDVDLVRANNQLHPALVMGRHIFGQVA